MRIVEHARKLREHLCDDLPNGAGNTIDALCDTIEQAKAALERVGRLSERHDISEGGRLIFIRAEVKDVLAKLREGGE